MKAEQARQLALALPQASEAPHFDYTSFRIGSKIFATMPLIDLQPEAYQALHWGAKVVGVKVVLMHADAATVGQLLRRSWCDLGHGF